MSKHQWYSLALVILLLVACINPTAAYPTSAYPAYIGFDPALGHYEVTHEGFVFFNYVQASDLTFTNKTYYQAGGLFRDGKFHKSITDTFTVPATNTETPQENQIQNPVTVAPLVAMGISYIIADGEITVLIVSSEAIIGAICLQKPTTTNSLWDGALIATNMLKAAIDFIGSSVSTQTSTTYGVTLEMSKAGTQQCTDAIHRYDYPTDKERGLPVNGNNEDQTAHKLDETKTKDIKAYVSIQLFNNQVDKDNGCPKQIRYFGKDGKPDRDIDFSHGAGLDTCEESTVFPHRHTWVDDVRSDHIFTDIDQITTKCKKYNYKKGTWCP